MHTHSEKPRENRGGAFAVNSRQKGSRVRRFGFVNNRQTSNAQRKLVAMMNSSLARGDNNSLIQKKIGAEIEVGMQFVIEKDSDYQPVDDSGSGRETSDGVSNQPMFEDLNQGDVVAKIGFGGNQEGEIHAESPSSGKATLEYATGIFDQARKDETSDLEKMVESLSRLTQDFEAGASYGSYNFPLVETLFLPKGILRIINKGSADSGAFQINVSPTGSTANKLDDAGQSQLASVNSYRKSQLPKIYKALKVQGMAKKWSHDMREEVLGRLKKMSNSPYVQTLAVSLTKAIAEPSYMIKFSKDFNKEYGETSFKNVFSLFPRIDFQNLIDRVGFESGGKEEFRRELYSIYEESIKIVPMELPELELPGLRRRGIWGEAKRFAKGIIIDGRPLVADRTKMEKVSSEEIESQNPLLATSSVLISLDVAREGVYEVRNPFTRPVPVKEWGVAIKKYEEHLRKSGVRY